MTPSSSLPPAVLGPAGDVLAWHMGQLHAYEQVLVYVLAFGPFLVLALVIWLRRRADDAEASDHRS